MSGFRIYKHNGQTIEAVYLNKGESFPDTIIVAPRQGVWGKTRNQEWSDAVFIGHSWRFIELDLAIKYLSTSK